MSDIYLVPGGGSDDVSPSVALVTESEVRTYLDAEVQGSGSGAESPGPSSTKIQLMIGTVSGSIVNFTGRDYSGGGENEQPGTRVFQRFGSDPTVAIDDCRQVSKVEVGNPGAWREIPERGWTAEPTNGPVKRLLRFTDPASLPASGSGWYFGRTEGNPWPAQAQAETTVVTKVQVTALWGAGAIPDHVRLAALLWISHLHKRDSAFFSTELAQGVATVLDIPPDVKALIASDDPTTGGVAAV